MQLQKGRRVSKVKDIAERVNISLYQVKAKSQLWSIEFEVILGATGAEGRPPLCPGWTLSSVDGGLTWFHTDGNNDKRVARYETKLVRLPDTIEA